MNVLAISSQFPNPLEPMKGLQILELLKYQAKFNNINIINPISIHSQITKKINSYLTMRKEKKHIESKIPYHNVIDGMSVYHPKLFYLPKLTTKWNEGVILFSKILPLALNIKRQNNLDVIHAHSIFPDGLACVLLGKLLNLPTVITHNNQDITMIKKNGYFSSKIQNYLVDNSKQNIVLSKSLEKTLTDTYNLINGKTKVVRSGVDIFKFFPRDKIQARQELNLPADKKILLFIGNLEPKNGINYLIDAMEVLSTKRKDICLYIIGDGKLKNVITRKIKKVFLQNSIFLKKCVDYKDIPTWINAANLFVKPDLDDNSYTDIVQSLACGTPVVANNFNNILEIIPSKDLGLITNPRDYKNLADNIKVGLDKVWNTYELVTRAKSFSLHKIAGELQQCYENL